MSGQVEGGAGKTKRSVQNAQRCRLSSNLIKFNLGNSVATPTPQLLQLTWAEQQQQQQRKIPKFWFNFFCVADSMEEIVIPLGETSVTRMPFKFRWHLFSLENKLSLCVYAWVCGCCYTCVSIQSKFDTRCWYVSRHRIELICIANIIIVSRIANKFVMEMKTQ